MIENKKHLIFGVLGIAAVVLGSLLFALVSDGSGDETGRVFAAGLGAGLHISGIGVIIAAVATYLKRSD